MTFDPIAYLKGRHTKQLLNLRDSIHAVNGWAKDESGNYKYPSTEIVIHVGEKYENKIVNLAQVKAELATREHIPNKAEAKVLRQIKAKAQRNK
jgi:hypothetical protein